MIFISCCRCCGAVPAIHLVVGTARHREGMDRTNIAQDCMSFAKFKSGADRGSVTIASASAWRKASGLLISAQVTSHERGLTPSFRRGRGGAGGE